MEPGSATQLPPWAQLLTSSALRFGFRAFSDRGLEMKASTSEDSDLQVEGPAIRGKGML